MNKVLLKHRAWMPQTKLTYGYDSSVTISTTKLSDRHATQFRRLQALTKIIKDKKFAAKVVNSDYGYHNSCTRVYFNIGNTEVVDYLLNITDKNIHIFEILEAKTPIDDAHLHIIHNKEITQVIRPQLYYGKYIYSCQIQQSRDSGRTYEETRALNYKMHAWLNDNMADSSCSLSYGTIQIHTNDMPSLMMFRLMFDIGKCVIKEAIVVEHEKASLPSLEIVV